LPTPLLFANSFLSLPILPPAAAHTPANNFWCQEQQNAVLLSRTIAANQSAKIALEECPHFGHSSV